VRRCSAPAVVVESFQRVERAALQQQIDNRLVTARQCCPAACLLQRCRCCTLPTACPGPDPVAACMNTAKCKPAHCSGHACTFGHLEVCASSLNPDLLAEALLVAIDDDCGRTRVILAAAVASEVVFLLQQAAGATLHLQPNTRATFGGARFK